MPWSGLGTQPWSNGKVGTMGDSYAGSDQAALATLAPPHLSTMIVAVGASNYYHSSLRQNGALEQRFLIYAFRMAVTSREAKADPALRAALESIHPDGLSDLVNAFPLKEGATILSSLPSYERWAIDILTHGEYDDYWKQRGYAPSEYYEEHADVPTLYLGGWYDSYARNTCESYVKLSRMKRAQQRLLMGPWTHGGYEATYAGDVDFGIDSHVNYLDLRLSWFDHYLKGLNSEVADWTPVRIFTMGSGDGRRNDEGRVHQGGWWRSEPDWPLPGTQYTPYYIHGDGTLSPDSPDGDETEPSSFTFDPDDPVPTIGGGISAGAPIMEAGAYDQRTGPRFFGSRDNLPLSQRADVLSFQTPVLEDDTEITGPDRDAALGLVLRGRHRLYGQAGRRAPAERPVSPRPRHQHHRLDHPSQIQKRLRAGRDDDARRALRARLPALSDVEPVQARTPDPSRHQQQQLAPIRCQPEYRKAVGPSPRPPAGPPDGLSQSGALLAHSAPSPATLRSAAANIG